jgi:hypothetical protein
MALRAAPNAIVVGSTTAGADGNVSRIPLPGGLEALITGIGVFYPDGTPAQRIGIVPDLVVRPAVQGIRDGRDEILEAGVSHALGPDFRFRRYAERPPAPGRSIRHTHRRAPRRRDAADTAAGGGGGRWRSGQIAHR